MFAFSFYFMEVFWVAYWTQNILIASAFTAPLLCCRRHVPEFLISCQWVRLLLWVGVVVGGCGRWCGCDLWERSGMPIMAFIYSRGLSWCRDISPVILNFLRRLKEDLLYAFSFLKQISLSTLNCWKVVFWNLARSKFIILSDYRSLIFDPLNTFYAF